MKTIIPIFLFFLLSNSVFAQQMYVTFSVGSCNSCFFDFTSISQLPETVPLKVVVPERFEPQGRRLIEEYTQLKRDFEPVYSDSLYELYSLPNSAFALALVDENQKIDLHFPLREVSDNISRINAAVLPKPEVVYQLPDSILLTNAELEFSADSIFVLDENNLLIVNTKSNEITHFHNLSIDTEKLYNSAYTDTIQYHYLMRERNSMYNIMRRDRILFSTLLRSNNRIFILSNFPTFHRADRTVTVKTDFTLLELENNQLVYKDAFNRFLPESYVFSINSKNTFLFQNSLYFPVFEYDTATQKVSSTVSEPYKQLAIETDKFVSYQSVPYINIQDSMQYQWYKTFIYANERVFNRNGNQYYNLHNQELCQLERPVNDGCIIAAYSHNGQIIVLTESDEDYELLAFNESGKNARLVSRRPLAIDKNELNSELYFADASSLMYLNFRNQIVRIPL